MLPMGLIHRGLFVHRKFIVGSTPSNPINLKEGVKARSCRNGGGYWWHRASGTSLATSYILQQKTWTLCWHKVSYKQGTQDSKPCALEVLMLGAAPEMFHLHPCTMKKHLSQIPGQVIQIERLLQ